MSALHKPESQRRSREALNRPVAPALVRLTSIQGNAETVKPVSQPAEDVARSEAAMDESRRQSSKDSETTRATSRRNFDVEDIVDFCKCGAPIYAESVGDDCVACRREQRRERL